MGRLALLMLCLSICLSYYASVSANQERDSRFWFRPSGKNDRCNRYNQLCPKLVFQQQVVPQVVQQQVVPEVVQQQVVPQVVQQQAVPEVVTQVPQVVQQQDATGAVPQQVVNVPVTQEDER
ncbi:hypothetical protein DAPPUDRAFT_94951 [Daphnia pulex]|uniref:Uncharacterized protein n=1 Tax=Daphnia pulex TaxID=6669 RepID=E9FTJ5_DAPPU|nr:hypothetical protein DAPPUDRAFT_94951 [Daphnia pulex]|eukprot:EFX89625.1 hypothetical protein DAPPUDRAFT_94951 [Daphnia pulex]